MPLPVTQNAPEHSGLTEVNDIFLVSDLHIADGRTAPFGKFAQGENFFWDESFRRFLKNISGQAGGRSQTLIINGDCFDFLRVNRIPHQGSLEDGALVERWREFLRMIDHPAAGSDLFAADASEREYGFKTHDYKSVWRMMLMFRGHPVLFRALGEFLVSGNNRLIIMRGNHDLEFFWEAVRQAFVFFLAGEREGEYAGLNSRIRFYQHSVLVNKQVYVEHGDRFDPSAW